MASRPGSQAAANSGTRYAATRGRPHDFSKHGADKKGGVAFVGQCFTGVLGVFRWVLLRSVTPETCPRVDGNESCKSMKIHG